jgi:hypothetical protein
VLPNLIERLNILRVADAAAQSAGNDQIYCGHKNHILMAARAFDIITATTNTRAHTERTYSFHKERVCVCMSI